MLPVKHLNRSLLGSVDLAPSDSVPVTNRVPVGPEIHANLLRLFALPNRASGSSHNVFLCRLNLVGLHRCS